MSAFAYCSGLTSVSISNSVTSIEGYVFAGCSSLTSVSIPNSVTYIAHLAFWNCSNMESCFIEDGEAVLTSFGGAFEKCPLRYVYIGRRLGDKHSFSPFAGCCSIKEVTFGRNITEIDDMAVNLRTIETMSLLNPTPPIADAVYFTDAQYMNLKVYVPEGSLEAYQQAPVWRNFWNLQEKTFTGIETVEADNSGTDAVIYDMQGRKLDIPKAGLNIINGKKVMIKK